LADFFGVGIMELENASLIKALDQLEPSGTFFELTSPDVLIPFFFFFSSFSFFFLSFFLLLLNFVSIIIII